MSRASRTAGLAEYPPATPENRLSESIMFARKFVRKGRTIASIGPSGAEMCEAMVRDLDFSRPGVILELGAGTGAITRALVSRMRPHHRLIAVELEPDFIQMLRDRFPQVEVLRTDATNMDGTLDQLGVGKVQYVLSGLATPHLPLRGQIRLHRWLSNRLDPGGAFIQITYVPRIYHNYYRRHFRDVRYTPIWKNMPPGGVFTCRDIRPFVTPRRQPKPR